jgi:hypothetical protein
LKSKTSFLVLNSVLPLLVGGMIYVCWRGDGLLMFDWFRRAGLDAWVVQLRAAAAPAGSLMPRWVVFSLPDALWVYAMTAFLAATWLDADRRAFRVGWISLACLLGAGAEVGQLAGVVPGTFDPADFSLCLLAFAGALTAAHYYFRKGCLTQALTTP